MGNREPVNVLFVCSRNKWRSPTAEKLWRRASGISVRSAGSSRQAIRTISIGDIRWADIILFMEDKHKSRVSAEFRQEVRHKEIHVLDIPDDYQFMDPELCEIILQKTSVILEPFVD